MPTVTLYESPTRFCELRPYDDPKNWQGGVDWIYKTVPLHGGKVWKLKGEVPGDAELGDHRVLSLGRRAVPRLDRRHGVQIGGIRGVPSWHSACAEYHRHTTMNQRERFLATAGFQPTDRAFLLAPWAWPATIRRWRRKPKRR